MKKNLSSTDRILRLLFVVVVAALYLTEQITGTVGTIAALVAVVLGLTSTFGFCPIYYALKWTTRKAENPA